MIRRACSNAVALVVLAVAAPALSQQYYLYTPKQINAEEQLQAGDGILVREMVINRGDTLSGISKKINGRGYYYPQILLFNQIKNPHLIHTGDVLRVPVKSGQLKPEQPRKAGVSSRSRKHHSQHARRDRSALRHEVSKAGQLPTALSSKTALPEAIKRPAGTDLPVKAAAEALYDQGLKSYQQGDYRSAIRQFDSFLADSPSSPLAADASLYKADCYLKLSGQ